MRTVVLLLSVSLLFHAPSALRAQPQGSDEESRMLGAGSTLALVGGTWVERAQESGYVETLFARAWGSSQGGLPKVRNIGWSGDDLLGRARTGFDGPDKGPAYLRKHIADTGASFVVLAYGMVETLEFLEASRAGGISDAELAEFEGLFEERLESFLKNTLPQGVQPVFVSPLPHERLGAPYPDPTDHNRLIAVSARVLSRVAESKGAGYYDLAGAIASVDEAEEHLPLTQNGIHLTPYGYWRLAQQVAREEPAWMLSVDLARGSAESVAGKVSDLEIESDSLRFRVLDQQLPFCRPPTVSVPPGTPPVEPPWDPRRKIRVTGLDAGHWQLEIDGVQVAEAKASEWAEGVGIVRGPEYEQVEALREAIVHKNFLWFCKWRPQNNTYLFLFRKHEQGDLAPETEDFDPLIEAAEREIEKLAKPQVRHYRLYRVPTKESSEGGER